jgi:hypothetical protein
MLNGKYYFNMAVVIVGAYSKGASLAAAPHRKYKFKKKDRFCRHDYIKRLRDLKVSAEISDRGKWLKHCNTEK